jgi:hypothetical protein
MVYLMTQIDKSITDGDSVQQAYNKLPGMEPSAQTDRSILKYATASTHPRRGVWVWPTSMAAAILVSLGIFSQMTHILPSGSYPRLPIEEPQPRVQRPVVPSGEFDQSAAMQPQTIVVEVAGRSREAWIEHLQGLLESDETGRFAQDLMTARLAYPDLELPDEMRVWLEQQRAKNPSGD